MTHMFRNGPEARAIRSQARGERRIELVQSLTIKGGKEIYSGLAWIAEERGYKKGWIAVKFKELFGMWPGPKSRIVAERPLGTDLEEWIALPRRRNGKARRTG